MCMVSLDGRSRADTLAPEIPRPQGMALEAFVPEVQRFFGCVRAHPDYSAQPDSPSDASDPPPSPWSDESGAAPGAP